MNAIVEKFCKALAALLVMSAFLTVPGQADQQEAKIGKQVYNWLALNGKIVKHSPLYDVLDPIADPLKAVADPLYDAPFIFTIGRDPYPNVASVPGGQVYVSEKTFGFIKYREEFAGALCHAVAHTIDRDYMRLARKNFNAQLGSLALWALILTGAWNSDPLGMAKATFLPSDAMQAYNATGAAIPSVLATGSAISAAVQAEREADIAGADLCAKADLNPWGIVWLLQNYKRSGLAGRMEMLTDTPDDRVRNLEAHFQSNPALFAKFDSDRSHATPLQ